MSMVQIKNVLGKSFLHHFLPSSTLHYPPSFVVILMLSSIHTAIGSVESLWACNWPSSLSSFVDSHDLVDIWRQHHTEERSYTWRRTDGSQASRLDMFWLSSSFVESVAQVDIFPFFHSDHSYIYLKLTFPSLPDRGPGVWKLNTSILQDEAFPSLAVWWDAGKAWLKSLL